MNDGEMLTNSNEEETGQMKSLDPALYEDQYNVLEEMGESERAFFDYLEKSVPKFVFADEFYNKLKDYFKSHETDDNHKRLIGFYTAMFIMASIEKNFPNGFDAKTFIEYTHKIIPVIKDEARQSRSLSVQETFFNRFRILTDRSDVYMRLDISMPSEAFEYIMMGSELAAKDKKNK